MVLSWQGSPCGRERGACVYATVRVVLGSSGRGWTLWRRDKLFFRAQCGSGKTAASPSAATVPDVPLALVRRHMVRLSHRPGYEPREGAFAPPRRPVPRVAVPRASGDVSLRNYPPWRRPTSHLAKSPLDKLRLGRSQCATIERPERDDKLVTALALRTKHPCEKLGPPRRHRLSAAPNSQH